MFPYVPTLSLPDACPYSHWHDISKTHSLCCWPQAAAATSGALAIAPIWRNGQPALRRLKPPLPDPATMFDAGWSSPVARQAHNLKVAGSNPAPATNAIKLHTPPLHAPLSFEANTPKTDRKSRRLHSSHQCASRMPPSAYK